MSTHPPPSPIIAFGRNCYYAITCYITQTAFLYFFSTFFFQAYGYFRRYHWRWYEFNSFFFYLDVFLCHQVGWALKKNLIVSVRPIATPLTVRMWGRGGGSFNNLPSLYPSHSFIYLYFSHTENDIEKWKGGGMRSCVNWDKTNSFIPRIYKINKIYAFTIWKKSLSFCVNFLKFYIRTFTLNKHIYNK